MRLNRKWILVIALVVSMATAISGTLAYLQATDTETNTFTVGNVVIDLTEPEYDENGGDNQKLLPGVEIAKDPTITNTGSEAAWVWMKVTMPDDLYDIVDIDWAYGNWEMHGTPTSDGTNTVVTMKWPYQLAVNEKTEPAFTTVSIKTNVTKMPESLLNGVNIVVDAYAIQTADAYTDINGAIAAYIGETGGNAPEAPVSVSTYEQLVAAIKNGGNIVLANDITVDEWVMFSETLNVASGDIITVDEINASIDGDGHTLTVNSIESADNGDRLFYDATKLNISNLTIKYADGLAGGGIGLKSGVISNVNFVGGGYAIIPGSGDIKVEKCTFATNGTAIYFEQAKDNLTVSGCTFNLPENANVILLRGAVEFTNNTVNTGRTVNIVSGSPVVTGNNFNNVRLKVYSAATATIANNTINNLEFETTTYSSTFADNNIMSDAAQAALNAVTKN